MYKILIAVVVLFSTTISAQSKLVFSYDAVGNQIERKYCPTGNCTSGAKQLDTDQITEEASLNKDEKLTDFINRLRIYPNPTKGNLRIEWELADTDYIKSIQVTDAAGGSGFVVPINTTENFADVDLTNYASGMYLVEFVLNDSRRAIKKIIKN
ncbi:T9SS type A sorting domain-containing protein [Aquimarina agarilytica]|uniref:T9SS type A sorting domain-containing protein n=1 Tax=Aquimarina agarilytica TaxID=1087449 RepID=UPI0002895823|nr:T9SS type A sorting domain-containing protein [Aquimarina agarilytica]